MSASTYRSLVFWLETITIIILLAGIAWVLFYNFPEMFGIDRLHDLLGGTKPYVEPSVPFDLLHG